MRDCRIACIGSRTLNQNELEECRRIGQDIATQGGIVVSGGAVGADQAFLAGGVFQTGPGRSLSPLAAIRTEFPGPRRRTSHHLPLRAFR
jgi:hypothetical protein